MTHCILCGRDDCETLTMHVAFADGTLALLDAALCIDCRAYLEDHGKHVVAR